MVESGEFRSDLLFRLRTFIIELPPLRERREDIPALIDRFLDNYANKYKREALELSPEARDILMKHEFPGNVRELQNILERAVVLNPQGPLSFKHLGINTPASAVAPEYPSTKSYNLDEIISQHLSRVLKITNGKINGADGAAALLGVNSSTLRNRMKKLGVSYGRNRMTSQ